LQTNNYIPNIYESSPDNSLGLCSSRCESTTHNYSLIELSLKAVSCRLDLNDHCWSRLFTVRPALQRTCRCTGGARYQWRSQKTSRVIRCDVERRISTKQIWRKLLQS